MPRLSARPCRTAPETTIGRYNETVRQNRRAGCIIRFDGFNGVDKFPPSVHRCEKTRLSAVSTHVLDLGLRFKECFGLLLLRHRRVESISYSSPRAKSTSNPPQNRAKDTVSLPAPQQNGRSRSRRRTSRRRSFQRDDRPRPPSSRLAALLPRMMSPLTLPSPDAPRTEQTEPHLHKKVVRGQAGNTKKRSLESQLFRCLSRHQPT